MNTSAPTTSIVPVLGRVFWAMLGPLTLLILLLKIGQKPDGWFAATDIVFWFVLVGVCFARWLEFRGGDPRTATGEPATQQHLQRYALIALIAGAATWATANAIGNYMIAT